MTPSVAVVVVNWNTHDLLSLCLASIEALPERADLEVVVVDNGSVDESVPMVRADFPGVIVVENKDNLGFASANNIGFRSSTAPYVLLLNSDTEVAPGSIATARDHLADHRRCAVVGCRIENPDGTPQNSVFRDPSLRAVLSNTLGISQRFPSSAVLNHDRYGSWIPTDRVSVEVVMGSFLMVRRADMEPDRMLDDGYFMYSEEADLCRRMRLKKKTVEYLPHATIMHLKGASSRTDAQRAWSDEAKRRGQLRFLRIWRRRWVAPAANLVMLVGLAPRALAWLASDLVRGGRRRLKLQSARFHFEALVDPKVMDQRFHPPPPPAFDRPTGSTN